MPWHITPIENVQSILEEGLQPATGPRSLMIGEPAPQVYLFSSFDDFMDADWVEEAFEEADVLALFHVDVPAEEGAWTEVGEAVSPTRLTLVSRDIDTLAPSEDLRGMDAALAQEDQQSPEIDL